MITLIKNIILLLIVGLSFYLFNQYKDEQAFEKNKLLKLQQKANNRLQNEAHFDESSIKINSSDLTTEEINFIKTSSTQLVSLDQKIEKLKAELKQFKLPQRIEVMTFTKKFKPEIESIKKIKIQYDSEASFYIIIQLFSDDTDETSPLVVQIRVKDIKSQTLIKEYSYNW